MPTKHGFASTMSVLLQAVLLHRREHHSPLLQPPRQDSVCIRWTTARWWFEIAHDSILYPFIHKLHPNPFLHPSKHISSYSAADSKNTWVDAEQPPVQTCFYGTPHLDTGLAGNPNSNRYFDIFHDDIHLSSALSCRKEDQFVYYCVKHILRNATFNKLFRNRTKATVSNFTSFHTWLKWLDKMSYTMWINLWQSREVCYNWWANPQSLSDGA